ncbi:MAG TPA: sigma 54-interacting transcriptional regulator [Polyangiaceae bacterium]
MSRHDETVSVGTPRDEGPLHFVVTAPRGTTTVALPSHGTVRIGRSSECEIVIDDESISRVHAIVTLEPTLSIADAGSRNGTVVLGRPVPKGERWPLLLRSVVQLGRAVLVLQRGIVDQPAGGEAADDDRGIVIASEPMRRLYESIPVLAASPLCALVLGETGVGKDVLASAIHRRSPRAGGPFVALNCAALPETVVESELFGHAKGAFTGAVQAKVGLFEAAHGGTLFLDEVAELPLTTQAKLLRALESGEVMPVGSVRPKRIDVRFIAATNQDVRGLVQRGRLREDLYFRLDGITVHVPPLRERRDDVMPLAERFAEQAARRLGRARPAFDPPVVEAMLAYAWPGNVRELRNVVERAVALSQGDATLRMQHVQLRFADAIASRPSMVPPPAVDEEDERQKIIDALLRASGNQTTAAKILGLSRRTLIRRIELYGISRPRKDAPH